MQHCPIDLDFFALKIESLRKVLNINIVGPSRSLKDVIQRDVEITQGCMVANIRLITWSATKKLQITLELLLRENAAHLENLKAKAKKLKPKLFTLLTCLED